MVDRKRPQKLDDETIRFILGKMDEWMAHSRDGRVDTDGVRHRLGNILLETREEVFRFVVEVRAKDAVEAWGRLDCLCPLEGVSTSEGPEIPGVRYAGGGRWERANTQ